MTLLIPSNEAERLQALWNLEILDTADDPAFDRITKLAAEIFETEISYISFVDESRVWGKSRYGSDWRQSSRDLSFCSYTILGDDLTVILDASKDPRVQNNPLTHGPDGVGFYAGAPIVTGDGMSVGSLCVVDRKPRAFFSARQRELLKTLTQLAVVAVEDHKRNLESQKKETEARNRYALVARATLDGVWDWDIENGVVYYSPRWQYILGLQEGECHADMAHWLDRVHPEDRALVETDMKKHLAGELATFRNEHRLRHGDGSWRWVVVRGLARRAEDGAATRMAGSLMDVTRDKTYDPLTGLPNRLLLHERLAELIQTSHRLQRWHFAVLFLDVDRFKQINDRFGHLVGDVMLKSIAERLEATVLSTRLSAESMVARFAGDEFVILLDGVENSSQAQGIAARLHAALAVPITFGGEQLTAGVSIGIAMARPELLTPENFLQKSDLAMYRAKKAGRGASVIFNPGMQQETIARLDLEAELKNAIQAGELRVHYQSQVDLRTGRIKGCEALVRWQHPQRGLLAPGEFIPLAEEIGLISEIDAWVMENACRQIAQWRCLPAGANMTMSVNVSGHHLAQRGLKEAVRGLLHEFALPPRALCLELTESVLMEDVTGSIRVMHELRSVGVSLHMDDFGSGYSSFKYLYQLPFDTLKIDRSFLDNIPGDPQAINIVEGILGLARKMGLKVIAEGIELETQAALLGRMGCDFGQGYYFDRPLDPRALCKKYLGSSDS